MIVFPADSVQRSIISCEAKNICYIAGRRVGKTRGVFRGRAIQALLGRKRFLYWYICPSYAQVIEEYNALSNCPPIVARTKAKAKQPFPYIELTNGSYIAFQSFDLPNNLRGSGVGEVFFDEVQNVTDFDTFTAVLTPLLKDSRALGQYGNLVMAGQFRGRNWIFTEYWLPGAIGVGLCDGFGVEAISARLSANHAIDVSPKDVEETIERFSLDKDYLEYASFVTSAVDGLIYQSPAMQRELKRDQKRYPKVVFDQEFLCLPTANSASIFRYEDIQAAIDGVANPYPEGSHKYIVAVDLGRVVDRCGIVVIDACHRRIVHEDLRPNKERHEVSAAKVAHIVGVFGNARCIIDDTGGATGGKHDHDEFTRYYRQKVPHIRAFTYNLKTKTEAVKNLSLALEQGTLKIAKNCTQTLSQLESYEYKQKGDRVVFQGPGGHSDDLVSAVLMALWGTDKGWWQKSDGSSALDLI